LEVDLSAIFIHAPTFFILKLRGIKSLFILHILFIHIKDIRESLQGLETGRKSGVSGLAGAPSGKTLYLVWFVICHIICGMMMQSSRQYMRIKLRAL
jgi:hypothetical protein